MTTTRRLRSLVLVLFLLTLAFVVTEPESALAHTKVHPGAVSLSEAARVADGPVAPGPVTFGMLLAVLALVAGGLLMRPAAAGVRRRLRSAGAPPGASPFPPFAWRGPPARQL